MKRNLFVAIGLMAVLAAPARAGERRLHADFAVDAPLDKAWEAWTTAQGLQSFFAPYARIEPQVGGTLDIWFSPDAPKGQRGAEDQRVMQYIEKSRFGFTWNAPPSIPTLRHQQTLVTLDFEAIDEGRTRVRFSHEGWGYGEDWDKCFDYFDGAWRSFVLPRFKHALEVGPIVAGESPELAPISQSIKVED
ncbi:MAG TPA: SRPBCC domain-containing protein [Acidobacteriota bacterium]|nr:SRPBCC domain-containing protein [Acidobacteriota bacterium]